MSQLRDYGEFKAWAGGHNWYGRQLAKFRQPDHAYALLTLQAMAQLTEEEMNRVTIGGAPAGRPKNYTLICEMITAFCLHKNPHGYRGSAVAGARK